MKLGSTQVGIHEFGLLEKRVKRRYTILIVLSLDVSIRLDGCFGAV
jgi:hypothetical protein